MSALSFVVAAVLAVAAPLGPIHEGPEVHLALDDQFEHHHDVVRYRGDVTVVFYCDKGGSEATHRLADQLFLQLHPAARGLPPERATHVPIAPLPGMPPGTRVPEVHMVHVACPGKEGPVMRGVTREQFRLSAGDQPIWIDFEDRMKEEFGFVPGVPNLVVIDAHGRLRYHLVGSLDNAQYIGLVQYLHGLRVEAVMHP